MVLSWNNTHTSHFCGCLPQTQKIPLISLWGAEAPFPTGIFPRGKQITGSSGSLINWELKSWGSVCQLAFFLNLGIYLQPEGMFPQWNMIRFLTFIYQGKVSAGCHLSVLLICWWMTQDSGGLIRMTYDILMNFTTNRQWLVVKNIGIWTIFPCLCTIATQKWSCCSAHHHWHKNG